MSTGTLTVSFPPWLRQLAELETEFPDYSREGTVLSQRRVFSALVCCLKASALSAPVLADTPADSLIPSRHSPPTVFYKTFLSALESQNAPRFPPPRKPNELSPHYQRRLILGVKPHVHRINRVLRTRCGFVFRGYRDHFRIGYESTSGSKERADDAASVMSAPSPARQRETDDSKQISPWEIIAKIMARKTRSEVAAYLVRRGLSQRAAECAIDGFGRLAMENLETDCK